MPFPPILRDSQGSPIPQVWDGANFQPYRGNMPLVTTHQNAAAANGNGVAADVDGYGSAMFQVTGTFSATVNFEGSVDGVNFVPIFVIDGNGNRVATTTSAGIFKADIAGLKSIRARVSNYVSGSVTVVSRALPVARPVDQSVLLNGSNVPAKLAGAGKGNYTFMRYGAIGAGVIETLCDLPGVDADLEALTMGCDSKYIALQILPYKNDNTLANELSIPAVSGTGFKPVTPESLATDANNENDFFKNFVYDATGNKYSLGMKRQARMRNGLRICVRNADGITHNAAVYAMVSELYR